jgi:calcineurin-like phosphoesterase
MSDAGMCGDYNSVLGMQPEEPLHRFITRIPKGRMEPALGPATLSGLAMELDPATGLARNAQALRIGGVLRPGKVDFWEE